MSTIVWLLNLVGIYSISTKGIIGLCSVGGICMMGMISKFDVEKESGRVERINREFESMTADQRDAILSLLKERN